MNNESIKDSVWLKSLTIKGYRSFGREEIVEFAIPNNEDPGSGLTILVGPNGGGKSTILECLHALSVGDNPKIDKSKRNHRAEGRVRILAKNTGNEEVTIETVSAGGPYTDRLPKDDCQNRIQPSRERFYFLKSRRRLVTYFSEGMAARESFSGQQRIESIREDTPRLEHRLFAIYRDAAKRTEFDSVLKKFLDPVPDWRIELNDGRYLLEYPVGKGAHNSEGMGDGLISLFFIADALYDSNDKSIIVIDEPELSLHPPFQRRLAELLAEYAATRQIIYATHSPYFICWDAVCNGASIARVFLDDNFSTTVKQISGESRCAIKALLPDAHNPHVLGLDAADVFFLEDGVILVEGQDDVIYYPKILKDLEMPPPGVFFGWGVGGASKMRLVAKLLQDLGFKRVAGILDKEKKLDRENEKEKEKEKLESEFTDYRFYVIPADDVRTKEAQAARAKVEGLCDGQGKLRENHREVVITLFQEIDKYLSPSNKSDVDSPKAE